MNSYRELWADGFESRYASDFARAYTSMSSAIREASPQTDIFMAFGRSAHVLVDDILHTVPESRGILMGKTVRIIPEHHYIYGDSAILADFFQKNVPEIMTAGWVTMVDDIARSYGKIDRFQCYFTGKGIGFRSIVLASDGRRVNVQSIVSGRDQQGLVRKIRCYYDIRKFTVPRRLTVDWIA